jgi:hypothetical protein
MKKEKEYEVVAEFTEGNCHYVISQPKEESTPEELEPFHMALAKILYSNKKGLKNGNK